MAHFYDNRKLVQILEIETSSLQSDLMIKCRAKNQSLKTITDITWNNKGVAVLGKGIVFEIVSHGIPEETNSCAFESKHFVVKQTQL